MTELLVRKLREYMVQNNPELLLDLVEENKEEAYLKAAVDTIEPFLGHLVREENPPYIIEEVCFDQLTKALRPSKYAYVKSIAEERFPRHYEALQRTGILVTELSNILAICLPIFEVFRFSEETEDDDYLQHAITTAMKGYFNYVPEFTKIS